MGWGASIPPWNKSIVCQKTREGTGATPTPRRSAGQRMVRDAPLQPPIDHMDSFGVVHHQVGGVLIGHPSSSSRPNRFKLVITDCCTTGKGRRCHGPPQLNGYGNCSFLSYGLVAWQWLNKLNIPYSDRTCERWTFEDMAYKKRNKTKVFRIDRRKRAFDASMSSRRANDSWFVRYHLLISSLVYC
jgi:hypothetical protein